ncbi:MAG: CotH kinase family protein [Clostridia bacterium]|nr:CotH kinase family protein [Clostridia bacterium]
MSTHRHFDKICCVILAFTLILTVLFVNADHFGVQKVSAIMKYEKTLFDTTKVHSINIIMDNWDEFTANCKSEEYYTCDLVIDDETYKNVAIRGKGNTSLSMVNNDRYSYKIEFDHYDSTNTYYGLDKLCLNNIIQDNTYMKDYITYQMMNSMGVAAPLCSYVYITVNNADWGLYLAVEGVEESFLQRNFSKDYGNLYKPDSMNMGGGRGNGEKFDMDEFLDETKDDNSFETETQTQNDNSDKALKGQNENQSAFGKRQKPENMTPPEGFEINEGMTPPEGFEMTEGMTPPDTTISTNNNELENQQQNDTKINMPGGMGGGGMKNGSDDVLLRYIDDNAESYSNIFNSAKTDITETDKTRLIKALKNLSSGEDLENTVDIDAVICYFVVHNFVLNFDSYTGSMIHNYYLYENDSQLQMIPWDYNLAFGGFQTADTASSLVNYPIDSPVSGINTSDRPMIAWVFANEDYTNLYHHYFNEFITSYFDSGYFEGMIDTVNEMISPYVQKDPTKFCTYEEFKTGISTLKEFCLLRAESVSAQLAGTIGATSDTQNSETLIDVGNLQISNMGSMGVGGKGKDNFGADMQNTNIIPGRWENSDLNASG